MNRAAVIVDTNVVVAGLLTADEVSPDTCILDGMLDAASPFVLSEALLAEYRAVLVRPKLRRLHGLAVAELEVILTDLARRAIVLTPGVALPTADLGDQMLWDLLAVRADLQLVTGDRRLLEDAALRGRVVSPGVFVARIWDQP